MNYLPATVLKHFIQESPPFVSWWQLFWVKFWGVKRVTTDGRLIVTMYYFGGKFYVTSIKEI